MGSTMAVTNQVAFAVECCTDPSSSTTALVGKSGKHCSTVACQAGSSWMGFATATTTAYCWKDSDPCSTINLDSFPSWIVGSCWQPSFASSSSVAASRHCTNPVCDSLGWERSQIAMLRVERLRLGSEGWSYSSRKGHLDWKLVVAIKAIVVLELHQSWKCQRSLLLQSQI